MSKELSVLEAVQVVIVQTDFFFLTFFYFIYLLFNDNISKELSVVEALQVCLFFLSVFGFLKTILLMWKKSVEINLIVKSIEIRNSVLWRLCR